MIGNREGGREGHEGVGSDRKWKGGMGRGGRVRGGRQRKGERVRKGKGREGSTLNICPAPPEFLVTPLGVSPIHYGFAHCELPRYSIFVLFVVKYRNDSIQVYRSSNRRG